MPHDANKWFWDSCVPDSDHWQRQSELEKRWSTSYFASGVLGHTLERSYDAFVRTDDLLVFCTQCLGINEFIAIPPMSAATESIFPVEILRVIVRAVVSGVPDSLRLLEIALRTPFNLRIVLFHAQQGTEALRTCVQAADRVDAARVAVSHLMYDAPFTAFDTPESASLWRSVMPLDEIATILLDSDVLGLAVRSPALFVGDSLHADFAVNIALKLLAHGRVHDVLVSLRPAAFIVLGSMQLAVTSREAPVLAARAVALFIAVLQRDPVMFVDNGTANTLMDLVETVAEEYAEDETIRSAVRKMLQLPRYVRTVAQRARVMALLQEDDTVPHHVTVLDTLADRIDCVFIALALRMKSHSTSAYWLRALGDKLLSRDEDPDISELYLSHNVLGAILGVLEHSTSSEWATWIQLMSSLLAECREPTVHASSLLEFLPSKGNTQRVFECAEVAVEHLVLNPQVVTQRALSRLIQLCLEVPCSQWAPILTVLPAQVVAQSIIPHHNREVMAFVVHLSTNPVCCAPFIATQYSAARYGPLLAHLVLEGEVCCKTIVELCDAALSHPKSDVTLSTLIDTDLLRAVCSQQSPDVFDALLNLLHRDVLRSTQVAPPVRSFIGQCSESIIRNLILPSRCSLGRLGSWLRFLGPTHMHRTLLVPEGLAIAAAMVADLTSRQEGAGVESVAQFMEWYQDLSVVDQLRLVAQPPSDATVKYLARAYVNSRGRNDDRSGLLVARLLRDVCKRRFSAGTLRNMTDAVADACDQKSPHIQDLVELVLDSMKTNLDRTDPVHILCTPAGARHHLEATQTPVSSAAVGTTVTMWLLPQFESVTAPMGLVSVVAESAGAGVDFVIEGESTGLEAVLSLRPSGGSDECVPLAVIPTAKWTFLAITVRPIDRNQAELTVYKQGSPVHRGTYQIPCISSVSLLSSWTGVISRAYCWRQPLSLDDIQQLSTDSEGSAMCRLVASVRPYSLKHTTPNETLMCIRTSAAIGATGGALVTLGPLLVAAFTGSADVVTLMRPLSSSAATVIAPSVVAMWISVVGIVLPQETKPDVVTLMRLLVDAVSAVDSAHEEYTLVEQAFRRDLLERCRAHRRLLVTVIGALITNTYVWSTPGCRTIQRQTLETLVDAIRTRDHDALLSEWPVTSLFQSLRQLRRGAFNDARRWITEAIAEMLPAADESDAEAQFFANQFCELCRDLAAELHSSARSPLPSRKATPPVTSPPNELDSPRQSNTCSVEGGGEHRASDRCLYDIFKLLFTVTAAAKKAAHQRVTRALRVEQFGTVVYQLIHLVAAGKSSLTALLLLTLSNYLSADRDFPRREGFALAGLSCALRHVRLTSSVLAALGDLASGALTSIGQESASLPLDVYCTSLPCTVNCIVEVLHSAALRCVVHDQATATVLLIARALRGIQQGLQRDAGTASDFSELVLNPVTVETLVMLETRLLEFDAALEGERPALAVLGTALGIASLRVPRRAQECLALISGVMLRENKRPTSVIHRVLDVAVQYAHQFGIQPSWRVEQITATVAPILLLTDSWCANDESDSDPAGRYELLSTVLALVCRSESLFASTAAKSFPFVTIDSSGDSIECGNVDFADLILRLATRALRHASCDSSDALRRLDGVLCAARCLCVHEKRALHVLDDNAFFRGTPRHIPSMLAVLMRAAWDRMSEVTQLECEVQVPVLNQLVNWVRWAIRLYDEAPERIPRLLATVWSHDVGAVCLVERLARYHEWVTIMEEWRSVSDVIPPAVSTKAWLTPLIPLLEHQQHLERAVWAAQIPSGHENTSVVDRSSTVRERRERCNENPIDVLRHRIMETSAPWAFRIGHQESKWRILKCHMGTMRVWNCALIPAVTPLALDSFPEVTISGGRVRLAGQSSSQIAKVLFEGDVTIVDGLIPPAAILRIYADKLSFFLQDGTLEYPTAEIRRVRPKWLYRMEPCAALLEFHSRCTLLIAFASASDSVCFSDVIQRLRLPGFNRDCDTVTAEEWCRRWQEGAISNLQYLLELNALACRSVHDLSRYPIVPWVLADYSSQHLDLTAAPTFRDLSLPMAAQAENQRSQLSSRWSSLETDGDDEPYHLSSIGSNPATVLHYLFRLEPYTGWHRTMHDGRFDHMDRLFYAWSQAYRVALNHTGESRELVPEAYLCPEHFLRLERKAGTPTRTDGEVIDSVLVPPWAGDHGGVIESIRVFRECLECDYVSQRLHLWIDLVFGVRQKGSLAVPVFNVPNPALDRNDLSLSFRLSVWENVGQLSKQIFVAPHPQKAIHRAVHIPQLSVANLWIVATDAKQQLVATGRLDRHNAVAVVERNGTVWAHSCIDSGKGSWRRIPSFNSDLCVRCAVDSTPRGLLLFSTTEEGLSLHMSAFDDETQRFRVQCSTSEGHFGPIQFVCASQRKRYLLSSSAEGSLAVWNLPWQGSDEFGFSFYARLFGPMSVADCADICEDVDSVATVCDGGQTLLIHGLRTPSFLRKVIVDVRCSGPGAQCAIIPGYVPVVIIARLGRVCSYTLSGVFARYVAFPDCLGHPALLLSVPGPCPGTATLLSASHSVIIDERLNGVPSATTLDGAPLAVQVGEADLVVLTSAHSLQVWTY